MQQKRYNTLVLSVDDTETIRDRDSWAGTATYIGRSVGPTAFGYAPGLVRRMYVNDTDIVHVHGLWTFASVAAILWSRGRGPYVVSPHGMLDTWALSHALWKKRACAAIFERRHLHGAACLHALNAAEGAALRAYGLQNPICVIPNGVDLPILDPPQPLAKTKRLLYLGRLHPKKGLHRLVQAWASVRQEAEACGWMLEIAGWDQSGHRMELVKLAQRLNVGSSISFSGPQFGDAKAQTFRRASAFVIPSLSEGLPLAVLEAWSWALPVLLTPQCNLPEGKIAGAAIEVSCEARSIVEGLRQLFSMDGESRHLMGHNGRHLVERQFQWDSIAAQMADVYDWILGAGKRPECVLN